MARSVAWTELAWRDLERAVETIARDSPTYAAGFARHVWEKTQSLDELSHRGRIVPELADPDVRELILASYRLLYEIHADTVYILGLINGARDLSALWEREGQSRREDLDPPRSH